MWRIPMTFMFAMFTASESLAGWFSTSAPIIEQVRAMPPEGYQGQWWTHPSGCQYSREGRAGEIRWWVVTVTVGDRDCPVMIEQKPYPGDFYGRPDGRAPRRPRT